MPDDALIVSPAALALGPVAFGGTSLPDGLPEEIAARADVRAIAEEVTLGLPARVEGSVFGHGYGSDVAVIGLDSASLAWLAPDVAPAGWIDAQPLPVLAPQAILDAYNSSFAPSNNLPMLTRSAFLGRAFRLEIGVSSLRIVETSRYSVPAELRGFSVRSDVLGVIVPLDFVRRMNATTGRPGPTRLIVFPKDPASAEKLADELKAKGLSVSAPWERLRNLRLLDLTMVIVLATALAILAFFSAVTAVFMAAAIILERRDEAELYHRLGLSRLDIVAIFVRRIAGAGAPAALAGAAMAVVLFPLGAKYAAAYLPALSATTPGRSLLLVALFSAIAPIVSVSLGAFLGGGLVIPSWSKR